MFSRFMAPISLILGSSTWSAPMSLMRHSPPSDRHTIRPCRQGKGNHRGINLHQTCFCQKIPQSCPHAKIFHVSQSTHILCAPYSKSILFGHQATVGLDVEVYFGHLDPTARFKNSTGRFRLALLVFLFVFLGPDRSLGDGVYLLMSRIYDRHLFRSIPVARSLEWTRSK